MTLTLFAFLLEHGLIDRSSGRQFGLMDPRLILADLLSRAAYVSNASLVKGSASRPSACLEAPPPMKNRWNWHIRNRADVSGFSPQIESVALDICYLQIVVQADSGRDDASSREVPCSIFVADPRR